MQLNAINGSARKLCCLEDIVLCIRIGLYNECPYNAMDVKQRISLVLEYRH